MCQSTNGRVGIGTSSPGGKLDVRGDIKLGSSSQYYAPGGVENLKIIRGTVDPAATIYSGTGFTVVRSSTGNYTVIYSQAFASPPTVVVSGGDEILVTSYGWSTTGFLVTTYKNTAPATDANAWFTFIAIGPR